MNHSIVRFLAILSTGLLAGSFFFATANILPTFSEVPLNVHLVFRVALMKHNMITMQLLMAMSVVTAAALAFTVRHRRPIFYFALASLFFALASFLVSRFGNVPINWQIKQWAMTSAPSGWQQVLARWEMFHYIRTVAAIASFFFCLMVFAKPILYQSVDPR